MKRYIGMLAVILTISCSPDQKLVKENEELLLLTKELTEVAGLQKQLAEKAQEEASRAQAAAEMNAAEAARQMSIRLEEVEKLRKQLEKCN
ncbi:MAG: hypothetical protein ABJG78_06180 [Cyclobacteriaceae bacterium]